MLTTLDESGLRNDTIVVFMADHGEYGAAHSFLMEKWHTAYQEALHVPVVVQSARFNDSDELRQIDALTSHVDIVPTLLGLADIGEHEIERIAAQLREQRPVPPFVGANLAPLVRGETDVVTEPDGTPREGVLFATDDEITQPLSGTGDPHQIHNDREYAVFLELVDAVRTGDSRVPHSGPVSDLMPGTGAPAQPRALRALGRVEARALFRPEPARTPISGSCTTSTATAAKPSTCSSPTRHSRRRSPIRRHRIPMRKFAARPNGCTDCLIATRPRNSRGRRGEIFRDSAVLMRREMTGVVGLQRGRRANARPVPFTPARG